MLRILRLILLASGLTLFLFGTIYPSAAQRESNSPLVVVLKAEGPVTSVMQGYIQRGLQVAASEGAQMVIIELNTPGGAISVMNEIIQDIRASEIPVIVYVSPRGQWLAAPAR